MGALWFGIQKFMPNLEKNRRHAIQGAVHFGTMFGLVDTFGLRLLRWPLVVVSAIVFVGPLFLPKARNRTTTQAGPT
jgi:hypothetical protein